MNLGSRLAGLWAFVALPIEDVLEASASLLPLEEVLEFPGLGEGTRGTGPDEVPRSLATGPSGESGVVLFQAVSDIVGDAEVMPASRVAKAINPVAVVRIHVDAWKKKSRPCGRLEIGCGARI